MASTITAPNQTAPDQNGLKPKRPLTETAPNHISQDLRLLSVPNINLFLLPICD